MADWQYQPYQGINPALLAAQVNATPKNAAGLNALSQDIPGITNGLSSIIQKNQLNNLIKQYLNSQNSQQGQTGMPNPFAQSLGQQTTMGNSPLSMMGQNNGGWSYVGQFNG